LYYIRFQKGCQAEGIEVSVVSGDRDLLQLADTHIKIRIPKTSKGSTQIYDYYPEDVKEQYQVTPTEFIDVKALMGDTSDNIPGIPGVGKVTAAKLIEQFGTLEKILEEGPSLKGKLGEKIAAGKDSARISMRLVSLYGWKSENYI
jgi:DNA polymerase-1